MAKRPPVDLKAELQKQLEQSLDPEGKIDAKKLKEQNRPLSDLFSELVAGKTTRDDPFAVSKDLANLINARDPKSGLGKAATRLEKALSKHIGKKIGGQKAITTKKVSTVKTAKTAAAKKSTQKLTKKPAKKIGKKTPRKV